MANKTKEVLITGISGMVGSHLADFLISNTDWEIHGLIRWRSPLENLENIIPLVNQNQRAFFHYGDLRDAQSITKVIKEVKPDYVFHLAAQSYPLTSFDAPVDTYDTNISGTSILLEALKNFSSKAIIHVCASSKFLEEFQKRSYQLMKNVVFIQHHLMLYQRLVLT